MAVPVPQALTLPSSTSLAETRAHAAHLRCSPPHLILPPPLPRAQCTRRRCPWRRPRPSTACVLCLARWVHLHLNSDCVPCLARWVGGGAPASERWRHVEPVIRHGFCALARLTWGGALCWVSLRAVCWRGAPQHMTQQPAQSWCLKMPSRCSMQPRRGHLQPPAAERCVSPPYSRLICSAPELPQLSSCAPGPCRCIPTRCASCPWASLWMSWWRTPPTVRAKLEWLELVESGLIGWGDKHHAASRDRCAGGRPRQQSALFCLGTTETHLAWHH